jgi:Xaa-Pro aminopeptidase
MNHSPQTYAARREAFVQQMGEGVAIFPAAPLSIRSHDMEYRHRQDNDFYYLTGFPSGQTKEIIEKGEHRRFFMHGTSHWLGMDVHDVGKYKLGEESRILEPGMVLTVEPGLYIAEDAEGVNDRYRGIGVRIEDDVLVTADGHEVLTAAIPKEIDDIETLRKGAQ